MCGHGPRISRTFLSIFFSTEPIPRIHGAQTYQRTRLWVPQLGKIIYRIFIVLSQFLFSIAFFRTKMVHRVFFWHLGFAGSIQFQSVSYRMSMFKMETIFDTYCVRSLSGFLNGCNGGKSSTKTQFSCVAIARIARNDGKRRRLVARIFLNHHIVDQ